MGDLKTLPLFILIMGFFIYCLGLKEINSNLKIVIGITVLISVGLYFSLNFSQLIGKK